MVVVLGEVRTVSEDMADQRQREAAGTVEKGHSKVSILGFSPSRAKLIIRFGGWRIGKKNAHL